MPLAALAAACVKTPVARPARNLVVVVVDTLRQDRLSCYGYGRGTSPAIDRLASRGALADGRAPSSWTKASTASLLTGLHPLRHQTFARSDALPEAVSTLAEILTGRGYQSLAIVANDWVSKAFRLDQGFGDFVLMSRETGRALARSPDVNRVAFERLARLASPFFLYVHYIDPHAPYDPDVDVSGAPLTGQAWREHAVLKEDIARAWREGNVQAIAEKAANAYDGEVRMNDAAIGALIDRLEANGQLRDTLVVVTSDHGEEFLEHGRLGHGKALYEESVRVPMVLVAPGRIPEGTRLGRFSLLDVVPTALSLLGVPKKDLPAGLDGEDLSAQLLAGGEGPGRGAPLLEHLDFDDGAALAWIEGGDKLLLGARPYRKELFDLAHDPGERTNRLGPGVWPEAARRTARAAQAQYRELLANAETRESTALDEELRENIVALGYSAFENKSPRRTFPTRLVTPDARYGGLRGWEDVASFSPCLAVAAADEDQLLLGWSPAPEAGGRWTSPEATFALPRGRSGTRSKLVLRGSTYRSSIAEVEIRIEERLTASARLPPGDFVIEARSELLAEGPETLVVRLTANAYRPADEGKPDDRVLGLFVREICLVADDG